MWTFWYSAQLNNDKLFQPIRKDTNNPSYHPPSLYLDLTYLVFLYQNFWSQILIGISACGHACVCVCVCVCVCNVLSPHLGLISLFYVWLIYLVFKKYYFLTAVLGSQQNWEEGTEICSCPYKCLTAPMINTPSQSGTCVTIHEPALTCYNHPKSTVYIGFVLGGAHSMGLDKYTTYIHDYTIVPNNLLYSAY